MYGAMTSLETKTRTEYDGKYQGTLYLVRVNTILFHASLLKATGQTVPSWAGLPVFLLLSAHPHSEKGFLGSLKGNSPPSSPIPWGGVAGPCRSFLLPFLCEIVTGDCRPRLPCRLQTRWLGGWAGKDHPGRGHRLPTWPTPLLWVRPPPGSIPCSAGETRPTHTGSLA